MGDLEMAKIIAEEVMKTGNQQQKAQAEALLTEL
jgi:FimV-like protein